MLTLEQIPMRADNYSYALINDNAVIMIDPSEPAESRAYFAERPHLKLVAILNTHSHIDHVGGNDVLARDWKVPVYGPAAEEERVPSLTHKVFDNDIIKLMGLTISAHDVHAHTIGHTAFFVHDLLDEVIKHGHHREQFVAAQLRGHKVMFVGDSLFAAGCGRLFEGDRDDLFKCLSFYREQHRDVLMACAHEYTKSNLAFARAMFPDHALIEKRWSAIDTLLTDESATVPCFFGLEHETNPFLMALMEPHTSALAKKFNCASDDGASIVGALRAAKDAF